MPNKVIAFDICPVNQLLNTLANQLELEYDAEGQLAAQGSLDRQLLSAFNQAAYYHQAYPKSLDNAWVNTHLLSAIENNPELVPNQLRTSVEHIASQIAQSIHQIIDREGLQKESYTLFATGGGAFNTLSLIHI